MSTHHETQDLHCPLCEEKVKTGHPIIQEVWPGIKKRFSDCHISWVYRDKDMQNRFFRLRKTKLTYPNSAHNVTKDGVPCARAMDLFQIGADKVARFDKDFYIEVLRYLTEIKAPFFWGGLWKTLGDFDHFQLTPETE